MAIDVKKEELNLLNSQNGEFIKTKLDTKVRLSFMERFFNCLLFR